MRPMQLSEKQRRHLKGLAHPLKPVILMGNAGLSEAVVAETIRALNDHELIKVRLPGPEQIMLVQQNENELEEKLRMARIHNSFIIIDVGGHDSPIARKAIFMADTIVTPVYSSMPLTMKSSALDAAT